MSYIIQHPEERGPPSLNSDARSVCIYVYACARVNGPRPPVLPSSGGTVGQVVLNPRGLTWTYGWTGGTDASQLTWIYSWTGSTAAAQHEVCRSRKAGDFSPSGGEQKTHASSAILFGVTNVSQNESHQLVPCMLC